MKNNRKKLTKKTNNNLQIMSIVIIMLYFLWPYITNVVVKYVPSNLCNISDIVLNVLFVAFLIFIYRKDFIKDFKVIKKEPWKCIKKLLLYFILMVASVAVLNMFLILIFDMKNVSANDQALYELFKTSPIMIVILTVLYYPILEGIVFRKTIKTIINKKGLFILVTCLLYFFFNIVYAPLTGQNILSSLYYIVLMFYMSKLHWDSDNFSLSVLLLMLYNVYVTLISL